MERVKREHTEAVLKNVVGLTRVNMLLSKRNGYFAVDLKQDGSGRNLKTGTLRECDTFIRGMFEGIQLRNHGY